jgi:hypothetical protein
VRVINLLAGAAFSLSATVALAADGVGEAMAVVDAARASGQIGERTLAVGSRVFVGDLVATDDAGEAQLLFADGTRMVVGANSSLVIDEFLFRGDAAANKFAVRALGGAFRFISGEGGDDGYSIRTPTATIGVRGTAFDFTVSPSGETKVVLLAGTAVLCSDTGGCATLSDMCELAHTDQGGVPTVVADEHDRALQTMSEFPFQRSQTSLLNDFRTGGGDCGSEVAVTNAILRQLPSELQNNPSPN